MTSGCSLRHTADFDVCRQDTSCDTKRAANPWRLTGIGPMIFRLVGGICGSVKLRSEETAIPETTLRVVPADQIPVRTAIKRQQIKTTAHHETAPNRVHALLCHAR